MNINNFNKFKNPLNNSFSFKVQNKNMNYNNNANKTSLGFNSLNELKKNSLNTTVNSFNIRKPKEEDIFKSNHFSSIDVMDESGRNIIQTEMRNKGSNW